MLTRRIFLRGSAIVMAGMGGRRVLARWLARAAPTGKKRKILVAIFKRGAADGLNIVVPFRRQAVPRIAAHSRHRARRRDQSGPSTATRSIWTDVRLERRDAAAEGALGQTATGDRRGHRFARFFALAFRCAGLHGIRHIRQDHGRWMAQSRAARSGWRNVAVARRRDGESGAAYASRRA